MVSIAIGCCGTLHAGYITMDSRAVGTGKDGRVTVDVASVNRGDEKGLNVRLESFFPTERYSSETFNELAPGAKIGHVFSWSVPTNVTYRQLVVPILTHYADANLYEFSSVSHTVVTRDGRPAAQGVAGVAEVAGILRKTGKLTYALRSVDGKVHQLRVRVVAPKEIVVEPREVSVTVPASGSVGMRFAVENFSGLPNSVYVICAIASEDTPDGVVETAFLGNVRLASSTGGLGADVQWALVGALSTAAGFYCWMQFGSKRRG